MASLDGRARILEFGLVALIAIPWFGPARATCWDTIDFGQLTEGCADGTAYCYVVSPGINTADSIAASFWSLTTGHPAIGTGDDNGAWNDDGGWLLPEGPVSYLGGWWNGSDAIDGCIAGRIPPGKTSEVMAVGLSDQDHYGSWGYFAIASVARRSSQWPEFDFAGGIRQDIALADIPAPQLTVSKIASGRWAVTVFPPNPSRIAMGVFGDGSAGLSEVVRGYRVYRKDTPLYGQLPNDRRRTLWTAATGVVALSSPVTFEIDCAYRDFAAHLALSLVFDGGFETGHVGESRVLRLCNWFCPAEFLYDLDGDGFFMENEFGCPLDCDDTDGNTYPGALESNDGRDNQCWGEPGHGIVDEISGLAGFLSSWDKTAFTWRRQAGATLYEAVRSEGPDFDSSCLTLTTESTTWADPGTPDPEHGFYYLVRALAPHEGSWGQDSSGAERTTICP